VSSSDGDIWRRARAVTPARIGLGRAGDALPTSRVLEFSAARAAARDAVHAPLDAEALMAQLSEAGAGDPVLVSSRAGHRPEYLRRPDLGRLPGDLSGIARGDSDVGIVVADGLSPRAVSRHGPRMVAALVEELRPAYSVAQPVVAVQARVALGDHIAEAMGVATVLVLVGERPGLTVAESLGIYLTHQPRPGRTDAERNCISNIHPPAGLGYGQAARLAAGLVAGARRLGGSGVRLKDTREDVGLPGPSPVTAT
jgi:ethanolamine ammonia-lyase small subunit